MAVNKRKRKMVQLLLDNNIDVILIDEEENIALSIAKNRNYPGLIRSLIQAGAEKQRKDISFQEG